MWEARPERLRCRNKHAGNLRIVCKKMIDQMQTQIFDGFDGMLPREGVHRVLHGVLGQNLAIVALSVRRLEVALKANGQAELFNVVTSLLARDPQQTNT